MPNYKDQNNQIHYLSQEDVDNGWLDKISGASSWVSATDTEVEAIRLSAIVPPTYQQLRAAEYPPMAMYLDGFVKGDPAQIQAYIDACLAVKAKYPKV